MIVPLPEPPFMTMSEYVPTGWVDVGVRGGVVGTSGALGVFDTANVAVTLWLDVSDIVQAPTPLQPAPDQPWNTDPVLGVAMSITVPDPVIEQELPHDIDPPETVPEPAPDLATLRL